MKGLREWEGLDWRQGGRAQGQLPPGHSSRPVWSPDRWLRCRSDSAAPGRAPVAPKRCCHGAGRLCPQPERAAAWDADFMDTSPGLQADRVGCLLESGRPRSAPPGQTHARKTHLQTPQGERALPSHTFVTKQRPSTPTSVPFGKCRADVTILNTLRLLPDDRTHNQHRIRTARAPDFTEDETSFFSPHHRRPRYFTLSVTHAASQRRCGRQAGSHGESSTPPEFKARQLSLSSRTDNGIIGSNMDRHRPSPCPARESHSQGPLVTAKCSTHLHCKE